MITISDAAAEKAKQILTAEEKAEWGLRVYATGGGCGGLSYGMDIDEKPGDNDDVMEKNGLKVFVDKDTSKKLEGMNIDFIDDGEKQGFVITGGSAPSCGPSCTSCE
ncbi:MAG: iron-sulfur cluster assembly accessory protein [Nitrospirae bacterium]|nr:iron-sulfur cluster assembly accessory protein [Nitrospirota bacterium]